MKKLIYILVAVFGAVLMTSCTGSARIAGGGGVGYGYYDDMYFYGHPGVYRNTVIVDRRPVIINNRNNRQSNRQVAPKNNARREARRVQATQNQRQGNARVNTRTNSNVRQAAPRTQTRTAAPARSTRSTGGGTVRSGRGGR
ncbi:hypothetical protein KI659_05555 [Litoribacter alkaliphilus]|uniref:Lipoprotein n=1 Tax=Litoribacter ruber TaxID=702568 RepID=A0AAP2CF75_9BACT|nr:hypothetical protein [Litoribacter alkaliphilus]MBS9523483.1 hypothetical protein [Litoribacter alkaliphilus]